MQDKITIKEAREHNLDYPIQKKNQCGLYVTWFVLTRLKDKNFSLEQVRSGMSWRFPFSGTHPWGVSGLLKREGLLLLKTNLKSLAAKQKMGLIKDYLQTDRLIILLGKQNQVQHYIVLSAYDPVTRSFEVYDPLVGRTIWSPSELLTFWSGGGLFGFYKWYAIVVSSDCISRETENRSFVATQDDKCQTTYSSSCKNQ